MKKVLREKGFPVALFLLISFVFLILFSWQTSPLYYYWEGDSSIFVLLGTLAKKGLVPYQEFFDHKGPFIYLIEYIGVMIGPDKIGIFILQILFLTATLCGVYKLLRLYTTKKISLVGSILSLMLINMYFEGGNLTEEYCLPFLVWSCYFLFKYIKTEMRESGEHKPGYAFLYGITFMVCFLTRVTNAMPICILIFVVLCALIYQKQWACLFKNAGFFLLGAGLCFLPFLVYFISKDALGDMLYGTIIYNVRYAANDIGGGTLLSRLNQMKIWLAPIAGWIVISLFTIKCSKKTNLVEHLTLAAAGVIAIIFQLRSMPYSHYLMIWMPMMIAAFALLLQYYSSDKKLWKRLAILVFILCVGVIGAKNLMIVKDADTISKDNTAETYKKEAEKIAAAIPQEARDKVLGYNVKPYFYIVTDIQPCFRFCILQDWMCGHDKKIYKEFENVLCSSSIDYLIMEKSDIGERNDIVQENYTETEQTENLILYRRNQ